ncbi:MAG: hypothetical protein WC437_04010 [Patescibacteria group bacterium]|nr:hypothetical protein [Patescibacteria group bacterium]
MAKKVNKKEKKETENLKIQGSDSDIEDETEEVDPEVAKEVFAEEPLAEDKKEAVFTEKFEEEEKKELEEEQNSESPTVATNENTQESILGESGQGEETNSETNGGNIKKDKNQEEQKKFFRPGIFGLGVLCGLIIALIIFGAFYYLTSKEVCSSYNNAITSEKKLTSLIISQKNRETAENSNCAIDLSATQTENVKNWQTVENMAYKYSFQVPQDWTKTSDSTDKVVLFESPEPKAKLSVTKSEGAIKKVSVNKKLDDSQGFVVSATSTGKVACAEAYIVISTDKDTNNGEEKNRQITAQFIRNGSLYKIVFTYPTDQGASLAGDYAEAFDLILKTVRFN